MKIMCSFPGENMQTQHNNLSYMIGMHFHDYSQYKLMEMDKAPEPFTTKYKNKQQQNCNSVLNLLELILEKKDLIFLELSIKYLNTLNNQSQKL